MTKTFAIAFLMFSLLRTTAQEGPSGDFDTTGLHMAINQHLATVKKAVEDGILPGRYMCNKKDSRLISTSDTLPGWEGFPVQLFEYKIADKQDGVLTTKVYLLNADAEKMARWIIAACWMVKRKITAHDIDHLIRQIDTESGGQFPIRGIVYEDLDTNGIQETYPFFDGVSASHKEFSITTPQRANKDQQEKYLSMTFQDVKKIYAAGRIISTCREQYKKLFPQAAVDGNNWCNIVREEYKKAMRSDVNYLINAWARANL